MKLLDFSNQLTPKDKNYQKELKKHTFDTFYRDFGKKGDITSNILIDKNAISKAFIIAKSEGVLAGRQEIEWFLKQNKIHGEFHKKDGGKLRKGTIICTLEGNTKRILAFERTILNLLQRMSGIATATANYVQEVKKKQIQIAATRKTPWGLLDKRAVCVGGGISHRLGLYDQILVKDTHLQFLKYDFEKMWQKLSQRKASCIEIEVESEKAAIQCIEAIKNQNIKTPIILMLDNMKPQEIRSAIEKIRKIKQDIFFEASGGIKNVQAYSESGVDFISLGAITHSAKAADFSLKLC